MVTKKVRLQKTNPLAVMPRSRTMAIATVFVSRLAVDDLRYDIHSYGTFLRYIPQRIGKNAALDAAVDAFATGFSTLHSDSHGLEAFQKYGIALKALGECLNDPVRGQTPETMCAIYLIMVVQVSKSPWAHTLPTYNIHISRSFTHSLSGLDWSARSSQCS
jgi:hypothetical protein